MSLYLEVVRAGAVGVLGVLSEAISYAAQDKFEMIQKRISELPESLQANYDLLLRKGYSITAALSELSGYYTGSSREEDTGSSREESVEAASPFIEAVENSVLEGANTRIVAVLEQCFSFEEVRSREDDWFPILQENLGLSGISLNQLPDDAFLKTLAAQYRLDQLMEIREMVKKNASSETSSGGLPIFFQMIDNLIAQQKTKLMGQMLNTMSEDHQGCQILPLYVEADALRAIFAPGKQQTIVQNNHFSPRPDDDEVLPIGIE